MIWVPLSLLWQLWLALTHAQVARCPAKGNWWVEGIALDGSFTCQRAATNGENEASSMTALVSPSKRTGKTTTLRGEDSPMPVAM